MSSRTRSYRPWLWSASVVWFCPPLRSRRNRRRRWNWSAGCARTGRSIWPWNTSRILEGQPLAADDKAAISDWSGRRSCWKRPRRSRTRAPGSGMVSEAKEGLNAFLIAPNHPRAVEGLLAVGQAHRARRQEQLNRARRHRHPAGQRESKEEEAREAAQDKQKDEARRPARCSCWPPSGTPKRRNCSAPSWRKRTPRPNAADAGPRGVRGRTRQRDQPVQHGRNATCPSRATPPRRSERNKFLEAAKDMFGKLDKGPANNRTVWVARAWIGRGHLRAGRLQHRRGRGRGHPQVERARGRGRQAAGPVLPAPPQLPRRRSANGRCVKVQASEQELRSWLRCTATRASPRRKSSRSATTWPASSSRWPRSSIAKPKDPNAPIVIRTRPAPNWPRPRRFYRVLAQADHDYTALPPATACRSSAGCWATPTSRCRASTRSRRPRWLRSSR